jgi:radical SAM protein with 4Fe4S-binding SPASM domain
LEIDRNRFSLNPDCFLVKGAKRGALYDLATGDVYSIDENSVEILDKCEKGFDIDQIIQKTRVSPKEIIDYLKGLVSLNLGKFLDGYQIINKIPIFLPESKIDFIWLELTQNCNLKCLHCYANSGSKTHRIKKDELLTLNQWRKVIQEAFNEGCRKVQFIGGEPILFGKGIYVLIKLARDLGYELIEVFTNATLLTEKDIGLLARYNVQIATSIYSKSAEIHDKITNQKGSFKKTIENVKKLQAKGIRVRFATIAMKQNEKNLKETIDFLQTMGETNPLKCLDIVRSMGRGKNNYLISKNLNSWIQRKSPIFPKLTKENFARRKYGHGCWWDKITVVPNGQVIPCVMARKEICGDIKKQSLRQIVRGANLQKLRRLSKDNIEICQDCEYRYACLDCRPLAREETGNLYARGNNCSYDPYLGVWQNFKEGR